MKKLCNIFLVLLLMFTSVPRNVVAEDPTTDDVQITTQENEEVEEVTTDEAIIQEESEKEENIEVQGEFFVDETENPVNENVEIEEEQAHEKEVVEEISYPAFSDSKTIDDVKITVEAQEDVFPEGATLSVEKVAIYVEQQVTEAIDQVREQDKNVVTSYTFDIKILDSKGNEIQPKDDSKVKVSFTLAEATNENLDTNVYHIDDKQEEITSNNVQTLDVVTEGEDVVVETNGFSIYTVEFTYNNKEYVLEGDTYVRLSDILDFVGLTGEVESWEISNNSLFTILKGDEYSISYDVEYIDEVEYLTPIDNPDGNILYMVALQMFDTEEWLDVTIDGIAYRIVVTDDAYVNGQAQTKITDARVEQGGNETNFTATMPLATIFINEDFVNMDSCQLLPPTTYTQTDYDAYVNEHGENPSWNVGDVDYDNPANTGKMIATLKYTYTQADYDAYVAANGTVPSWNVGDINNSSGIKVVTDTTDPERYGQLYFDFSKGDLSYGSGMTDNLWSGSVVEYRFINAAERFNTETQQYEKMDVIITYSNLHISLQNNLNSTNYGKLTRYDILDANKIQPKLYASEDLGGSANDRTGLKVDVNVQVVDKNNNLINGSYYFPLVDADVGRTGASFGALYQATTTENNRYSEMFMLLDNYGQPTSTGEWEQKIWIPGGDYDKNKAASQTSNMPYLSMIDNVNGNLRIKPGAGYSSIAKNGYIRPEPNSGGNTDGRDEDFYTGFATLANNAAGGVKFRYWGTSAYNAKPDGSGTVTSFVLAGTQRINHKLDASSDVGGTIYTTTTGNADGTLSGGELIGNNKVNTPHELSAATGQNVTYTLSPNGGYKIKNVYIKNGDIDILPIIQNAKNSVNMSDFDLDNDGELDETEQTNYDLAVNNAIDTALAQDNNTYKVNINTLTDQGHGIYSYTFQGINEDNSIHVEWEKTQLTVTKNIEPAEQGITHKFNFQIRLWDTSTQESAWRVRARKYNGNLIKDTEVEEDEVYYMSYYESHNEEGDIELYNAIAQADIDENTNPMSEGWYEKISYKYLNSATGLTETLTRYVPTSDEEPYIEYDEETGNEVSRKTYYRKEVTQGNIMRYYQHILGFNEETGLWESYDIKSNSSNADVADVGLTDLDVQLANNYRFEYEEDKVWLVSAYDTENNKHTKYLMWVYDEDVDGDVLVAGNAELYPDGVAFEPSGTTNNYVYIWEDEVEGWSGKIIKSNINVRVNGQSHTPNASSNHYKYEKDLNNPVHYDFVANPEGYALDSGYSKLTGETGMYIIILPAGQSPDLSAFEGTGWTLQPSAVSPTGEVFDMDAAFVSKGATPAAGANTYNFSLAPGETIDLEGCVPMGWNYEITEVGLEGTIWELKRNTANATISDYDGEEDVEFINQKRLYDLTIEKQTINDAPGTFSFKVKVWKETVIPAESEEDEPTIIQEPMDLSTQFGNPDSDGYYSLTLSNNDSVTIEDILYGYKYEIIEVAQDNWRLLESVNASGMISSNTTSTFTNEKIINLTIRKEADVDTGEEFNFEVKIHGWKQIFSRIGGQPNPSGNSLPEIAHYKGVPYNSLPSYQVKAFVNNEEYAEGSLMNGDYHEDEDTWRIEVNDGAGYIDNEGFSNNGLDGDNFPSLITDFILEAENYVNLEGNLSFDINHLAEKDGFYTFKLKAGEELTIPNIPYGYEYEIYELDSEGNRVAVGDVFDTKWTLKSATNTSGTLEESTTSIFANEMKKGSIKVNKETKGNEEGEFEFKIRLQTKVDYINTLLDSPNQTYFRQWIQIQKAANANKPYYLSSTYSKGNTIARSFFNTRSTRGTEKDAMYWYSTLMDAMNNGEHNLSYIEELDRITTLVLNHSNGIKDMARIKIPGYTNGYNQIAVLTTIEGSGAQTPSKDNFRLWFFDVYKRDKYFDLSSQFGEPDDEGYYHFTLNNDEEITISNIPYGYTYEVEELTPDGWDLVSIDGLTPRKKAEGTIESEEPYEHTFLNAKRHTLVFEKKVSGNMGDKHKEFEFVVTIHSWKTIYNDEIESLVSYGYDGSGTIGGVKLKNPDKNRLGIQNNYKYNNACGIGLRAIGDDTPLKEFFASSDSPFHQIEIDYTYFDERYIGATGNDIDGSVNFRGKSTAGMQYYDYLDLSEYGGYSSVSELCDPYNDSEVFYTFKLKHGDKIEIEVPYGYTYEIYEEDYSDIGYKQSVDGKAGREVSGELTEDKNHLFENRNQAAVPTEIRIASYGAGLVGISILVILIIKKNRRKSYTS